MTLLTVQATRITLLILPEWQPD